MRFLFGDHFIELAFGGTDPGGQLVVKDLPVVVLLFLHFEHDAVAALVGYIDMEQGIVHATDLAEIEFTQAMIDGY